MSTDTAVHYLFLSTKVYTEIRFFAIIHTFVYYNWMLGHNKNTALNGIFKNLYKKTFHTSPTKYETISVFGGNKSKKQRHKLALSGYRKSLFYKFFIFLIIL